MLASTRMFSLLCSSFLALGQVRPALPLTSGESAASPPVIVIGFVGGFVRHDNLVHSPVQLATRLRDDYPSGVYVEAFENRHRENAHGNIAVSLLRDTDNTYWTRTVWTTESAMKAFMLSGPHGQVMRRLLEWCDEAALVHWEQETIKSLSGTKRIEGCKWTAGGPK